MEESQFHWHRRLAVNTIRYEGLHVLLWRLLQYSLSPLGRLGMLSFCRKDLTQRLLENQAKVDLTINQAIEADIDQLAMLVSSRYGPSQRRELFSERSIPETILDQFEHGAKCFVARIGEEIVHYNWIFFHKKIWEPGPCYITMGNHETLCDDAFTPEKWRGKAIHGAVHNEMLIFLQRSGFETAYTLVNSFNLSSKKALQKLGWDFFANLLYFIPHKSQKTLALKVRGSIDPFKVRK